MEGFVILSIFGAGIAFFAFASAAKKRAAVNEAWRQAALQLGLLFRPGDLFSSPRIVGTLRGCQVSVGAFTKSSDKARWTRYRVEYRAPHRFNLHIRRQGMLAGIRKAFGQPGIEVGDRDLDARLDVRGSDPDAIRAFLNPLRWRRILALFDAHPGLVIEHHRLTWEVKGLPAGPGSVAETVERLAAAAEDLSPDQPAQPREPTGHPVADHGRTEPPRLSPPSVLRASASPSPRPVPPPAASPPVPPPGRVPDASTEERRAPPGADAGDVPGPAVAAVSAALFGGDAVSYEVPRLFAERYRSQSIRWSGELRTVSRYPFDRVFGNTPGTRATFVVHQMETPLGRRSVQAIVQLPAEAMDRLRTEVGTLFVFEGRLVDCDSFMRSIFVGDGRVVWARADSPTVRGS